ncbi:MAG: SpoIIIAH-like family protein [Clostridia bacterium]|nr:SpoIIIAH-like family protein [Clostridia bacterium]
MKVLKRNQLIVLLISLMLITAGYLNFTANQENIMTGTIADRSDTAIGDAELVSTIPHEENVLEQTNGNIVENKIEEDVTKETNVEEKTEEAASNITNEEEIIQTSTEDYYFTTAKLERNTMYSESLETYQEMYNNINATAEAKADALSKINNINNTKNAIMIAENLIIAKGFEDVVIFSNEGSVSVIVKIEELKQEEVAQIQNIVSRELNVGVDIIHISNK